MMSKILGLLAVALLAGPVAANASTTVYDFNSTDGGFTVNTPSAVWSTPWTWTSGSGSWQVNQQDGETGSIPMSSYLTSPNITLGGALSGISFVHRWSMEPDYWDGGAVQYSINGGGFTTAASACFSSGGYNGTVRTNSISVLAGQSAFVLDSPGFATPSFVTSTLGCLSASAGDALQLRFLYAGDSNTRGNFLPSWEIDSVAIETSGGSTVPEPGTLALLGLGLLGLGLTRRKAA